MDNLRFIRETMERSASFTAVARAQPTSGGWVVTWLTAAALSFATAVLGMAHKSRSAGMPLLSGPGRKFAFSFSPPILIGGLLTLALFSNGQAHLLPGTWLLLYGTAVVTGGAHSVRIVPLMGVGFILVGACALFAPPSWGDAFMATGFGVLHVAFGALIGWKHGG